MINVSLVIVLSDYKANILSELKEFYDKLERCTDNFDITVINTSYNEGLLLSLLTFCDSHSHCKVQRLLSYTLLDCVNLALSTTEYDNIIFLNNEVSTHSIDLDYVVSNYTARKNRCCFALFNNSNEERKEISGVVLKRFDLKQIVSCINVDSMTELMIQLCVLYSCIGNVYRVNYKAPSYPLYASTIEVKGIKRFRLRSFLRKCKRIYPKQLSCKKSKCNFDTLSN